MGPMCICRRWSEPAPDGSRQSGTRHAAVDDGRCWLWHLDSGARASSGTRRLDRFALPDSGRILWVPDYGVDTLKHGLGSPKKPTPDSLTEISEAPTITYLPS
jgi:hypothetical protein